MNAYCLKYCVRSDNKNRCRAKYSSSVSRLLFDEFPWNFSIRSLHACTTNGVVGVRAVKMNGTSFGQQSTFSSVSRLLFEGFCWSFKPSNFHACAKNCYILLQSINNEEYLTWNKVHLVCISTSIQEISLELHTSQFPCMRNERIESGCEQTRPSFRRCS